jgi:hypothetical protein
MMTRLEPLAPAAAQGVGVAVALAVGVAVEVAVGVGVGVVVRPVAPGVAVAVADGRELVRPLCSAESDGSSVGTGKSGQWPPWAASM